MIDKETILRLVRESGMTFHLGQPHEAVMRQLQAFAAALLAHRAESGVEVPEVVALLRTLGEVRAIPDDPAYELDDGDYKMVLLTACLDYGNARAAEALERAAKVAENWERKNQTCKASIAIRSLAP